MGPEEEDQDSLLVSVVRLKDLNTHTQSGVTLTLPACARVCACPCVCVCARSHPRRPVGEALHLGEHQVSLFVLVSASPRHPAAAELGPEAEAGVEAQTLMNTYEERMPPDSIKTRSRTVVM